MRAISRKFTMLAFLAIAVAGASVAQAEGAAAGDAAHGAKIGYTCLGCHGIADYRNAYPAYHVPKIGGQHADYITAALAEYRSGARPHPTMKAQATSLSEQDSRDLAAYFATATPVASQGKTAGTLPAAAQACAACHGADGVAILPEYPTLAGQQPDYIEQALKAYRKGTRQNAIMAGFAATLKDEDIHAVAEYFSKQSPALWVPRAKH
jgi:cytochrome c553